MFGFFLFFYSIYLLFSSDPNPIQHCLVYRYGSAVKNLNKFYTCIGQGNPKKLRLKPNVRYFMVALYFEAIAWMRLSKSDRNEMFGYFWSENQLEFVGKFDLTQRIWNFSQMVPTIIFIGPESDVCSLALSLGNSLTDFVETWLKWLWPLKMPTQTWWRCCCLCCCWSRCWKRHWKAVGKS